MTPDYLWRFRFLAPDARGAQPVARTVEPVVVDAVCADERPEFYVMSSASRCTVHPQHILVNQGYSHQHYADIFECACGIRRLGRTDEHRARFSSGGAA